MIAYYCFIFMQIVYFYASKDNTIYIYRRRSSLSCTLTSVYQWQKNKLSIPSKGQLATTIVASRSGLQWKGGGGSYCHVMVRSQAVVVLFCLVGCCFVEAEVAARVRSR